MPTSTAAVLSVRVSVDERALLRSAAQQSHTTLSDFVRRRALEAAEMEVLERRVVIVPAADWEKAEAWAAAPARDVPALRRLATAVPAWRD